ncbi:MAG TPA: hypothetical protein VMF52_01160 [Steroidobacteraceae bacterium]|nr:hypothetical protein [Steroidobacteraceae bacterium]
MSRSLGKLTLFVVIALHCASAHAQHYRFESRDPTASWFAYGGFDWQRDRETDTNLDAKTLEVRMSLPSYLEFSIRGSELRKETDAGSVTDFGDTTISVTKGTRRIPHLTYASIEYGEVAGTAPRALRSETDRYARVRALFGPTLLTFDVSVTALQLNEPLAGEGDEAFVTSFGIRSQCRQFYYGIDAVHRAQSGADSSTSADFVAMYRRWNGDAIYLTLGKGLDGDEAEFAALGYEYRF